MTTLSNQELANILESVQEALNSNFIFESEQKTQIGFLLEPCSQEQKKIIFDSLFSTGYINFNNERLSLMVELCDIKFNAHVVNCTKETMISEQSLMFTSKHQQYNEFLKIFNQDLFDRKELDLNEHTESLFQKIFLLVQEKDTSLADDIINLLKEQAIDPDEERNKHLDNCFSLFGMFTSTK